MSGFLGSGAAMTGSMAMSLAGVTGNQMGYLSDEEKCDLYKPRFNWNYQKRTNDTVYQQTNFVELWPTSTGMSNGANLGLWMIGQDSCSGTQGDDAFEGWSASTGGSHRDFFISGQVQNNLGAALAACNLDLFLTSTNQFVSTGISDQNGNFQLPTPFSAQNHYIYANYASGTYIGGSVNTLTPS